MKKVKMFNLSVGLLFLLIAVGCTSLSQSGKSVNSSFKTGTGITFGLTPINFPTAIPDPESLSGDVVKHEQRQNDKQQGSVERINHPYEYCDNPHCQSCVWERGNKSPYAVRVQNNESNHNLNDEHDKDQAPLSQKVINKQNELEFNQAFDVILDNGGGSGRLLMFLKDGRYVVGMPSMYVLGNTRFQRGLNFVGNISTGAGIAAAGELIDPSENIFKGGSVSGGNTSTYSSAIVNKN
jgi:hypothetical protein